MVDSALKRLTLQELARTRLAMRLLALLTAAQAPLSAGDLGHALAMLDRLDVDGEMVKISREEVPDAGAIEECCTGLIAIDLGSGTVRVARVCMAYLSLSVFSTGPCPDSVERPFAASLKSTIPWITHHRSGAVMRCCLRETMPMLFEMSIIC